MIFNKEKSLERCFVDPKGRPTHKENKRVHKALTEVFDTDYPKGTNLVIEFMKKMKGTPYGAVNMIMDNVVDCAELPRITYWIFFGKDIGSWSDGQYYSKLGKTIGTSLKDQSKFKPLDLIFYNTSKAKKSGHVATIINDKEIIQSGASEHKAKVGISKITWGQNIILRIRRFLSDEEYNSIIVGGKNQEENQILLYKGIKNAKDKVSKWQNDLHKVGYSKVVGKIDGIYGKKTESGTKEFQKANYLKVTGYVIQKDLDVMAEVIKKINSKKPVLTRILKYKVPYIKGKDVQMVQQILLDKGYAPGKADGVYGQKTKKAVIKYQKANKLKADGVVGKYTWASLFN